jgi:putative RecB family exonuclease
MIAAEPSPGPSAGPHGGLAPGSTADRGAGPTDGRVELHDPAEPLLRSDILSPSRASDFLSCPLRYRFRVIDRIPEQPSEAAVRGTVVHSVLERLFDLPASQRTVAEAVRLLEPQWQALLEAEPELAMLFDHADRQSDDDRQSGDDRESGGGDEGAGDGVCESGNVPDPEKLGAFLAGARTLLDSYFQLEDPTRLEPAEREMYVECVLDSGLLLRGYIDRLDEAPDGALRVVDYKTGKAPGDGYEQRAMFQMRFYALVLWRLRGVVPRLLQLVYLGSGHVLRYSPDEADLLATERKLQAVWKAIDRARTTGEWRASPSRLCDWCDHKIRCPAWGGTPPPLPAADPAADAANGSEAPSPHSALVDL